MHMLAQVLLWLSLCSVAYAYLLYPIVIYLCSRLLGSKPQAPSSALSDAPMVSLLIAASNEEQVIRERIENALQLDYPSDKLKIVIASDGSVDRTAEIVRCCQRENLGRIQLLEYSERRGKAAVLNIAMRALNTELVLLSDANTFFASAAALKMVRWFANPQVGVVCGKLTLVTPKGGKNVDSLYWRYETFLKECEGRLGALLGSNGAIYAIRRCDYVPVASDTIIDDFMIPLLIRIHGGKRIVYDTEAMAHEETPADIHTEFSRRCRIGAGGFQSLARLWQLLLPAYGWTAFAFWSHKIMRWCCPAFLVIALLANATLAGSEIYGNLMLLQIVFYGFAVAGNFAPGNARLVRLLRLTTMFTSMNLAIAVGFFRWGSGLQSSIWQRTARVPTLAAP